MKYFSGYIATLFALLFLALVLQDYMAAAMCFFAAIVSGWDMQMHRFLKISASHGLFSLFHKLHWLQNSFFLVFILFVMIHRNGPIPIAAFIGITIFSFTLLIVKSLLSATDGIRPLLIMTAAFVILVVLFAFIYCVRGISDGIAECHSFYNCLYFSIVTWTTLGYGDFKPTPGSRFYASVEALLGYIFMGLYVALLWRALERKRHT